jgi:hypothetical protein
VGITTADKPTKAVTTGAICPQRLAESKLGGEVPHYANHRESREQSAD